MKVIDIHGHFGYWPFAIQRRSKEDILQMCQDYDIEYVILSAVESLAGDLRKGNKELFEQIKDCPKLLGYVTLNINYVSESKETLERYIKSDKFVGVKIHPGYCRQSIDSAQSQELLKMIQEYGIPVLVHTMGKEQCQQVFNVAKQFPMLQIIMAHGGNPDWDEGIRVLCQTDNLYQDMSTSFYTEAGKIEKTVKKAGADRILYGSDINLFSPGYALGMVKDAEISDTEKEMILYKNAVRLFKFKSRE